MISKTLNLKVFLGLCGKGLKGMNARTNPDIHSHVYTLIKTHTHTHTNTIRNQPFTIKYFSIVQKDFNMKRRKKKSIVEKGETADKQHFLLFP